ncbi:hypothetical protein Tco_1337586 [Tanacetum coccineum]
MIDELSIVKTDKVIHTVETDKVKQIVDVESSGKSADEIDKETVSFGEMQLKQEDRSCVHASIELHLHGPSCLCPSDRKSIQKLGIDLKLLQWHLVNIHIIE